MLCARTCLKARLEGLAIIALVVAALPSCGPDRNGGAAPDAASDRGRDSVGEAAEIGSVDGPAPEAGLGRVDANSSERTSTDTGVGGAGGAAAADASTETSVGGAGGDAAADAFTGTGVGGAGGASVGTGVGGAGGDPGSDAPIDTDGAAEAGDGDAGNNCNGLLNENCTCINGAIGNCGEKLGALGTCATGTTECVNGAWGPCSVSPAAADICDGVNDDTCDGQANTGCQCGAFPMPNPSNSGLPHPPSYTDNGDDTVTDNVTGLIWEKSPSPTSAQCTGTATATTNFSAATCTFYDAWLYCAYKGPGWRLPTRMELMSLMDYTVAAPGLRINEATFPGTPSDLFWAYNLFTPYDPSHYAWALSFSSDNSGGYSLDTTHRVRCVQEPALKCYSSRYQLISPELQFMAYDAATGLTWDEFYSIPALNLDDAIAYCAGVRLDGSGWRLPSIMELLTIVDDATAHPAIDPIAFAGSPNEVFWTSTPVAGVSDMQWGIYFDTGIPVPGGGKQRARCVRGPGGPPGAP